MWDRRTLKERGKSAFKANYWIAVLVAFILLIVAGGGTGSAAGAAGFKVNFNLQQNETPASEAINPNDIISSIQSNPSASLNELGDTLKQQDAAGAAAVIFAVILGVVAVVGVIALLLNILIFNPIQVGCQSFFIRNSQGQGELNNLERGFKPNWGGNVKTMFLRDLFLILWSLLFFIPGIIKSYSYRMVPYILADHPEMSGKEVITLSRQMMNGSKWRAFVLDLSFIGWDILSLLTLGLLGIFYVSPYKCSTNAELYHALKNQIQG